MPWESDPAIQSLRLTYTAALAAYQHRARAITVAVIEGLDPSAAVVAAETKARRKLDEARQKLSAVSKAMTGRADLEPPSPPT
jgi:hypothetical protein